MNWLTLAFASLAAGSLVMGSLQREVRTARACTPGPPFGVETAATADAIALVEAVRVGTAENRAPTVAPTSTPSASATATERSSITATPSVSPSPSPTPFETAEPYHFDLTGHGATLRVIRMYAGDLPKLFEDGVEARAWMEQEIRHREAYRGPPIIFSDCPIEWSTHQWQAGAQYLIFTRRSELFSGVMLRYRVEDGDLVLVGYGRDDPRWYMEAIGMQEPVYRRFFGGVPADIENGYAILTATRLPAAMLLRAVAGLRGDPSIIPPETGNAGIKTGH
jgi:hypothetical protein